MSKSRAKNKGRIDAPGGFAGIPRIVMGSPDFQNLSGGATKLLLELARQYKGGNNGNLTVAYSILSKRGFNSKGTITRCIEELISSNLVIRTREAKFLNPGARCALYALTWAPIDECPGKCLELSPSITAPRKFSIERTGGSTPRTVKPKDKPRNAAGRYVAKDENQ